MVGVGPFNLPTSLAGYGPITLVSMGAENRLHPIKAVLVATVGSG
jgi:hypothetical protein